MALPFQLSPGSGVPAYRQIVDQVRFLAAAGALPPGTHLPSIRELARHLGVNTGTVIRAYDELAANGTVEQRHGAGVFLSGDAAAGIGQGMRASARRLVDAARKAGLNDDLIRTLIEEALRASP